MAAAAQRNASPETEGEGEGSRDAAIADANGWLEGGFYKFRLDAVKHCGASPALSQQGRDGGPLASDDGTAPSAAGWRGGASWVGALVRVTADVKETFVSPRDLTLQRGGVILRAKYGDVPLLRGCQPLLQQNELRAGHEARGFALFEVPAHFRAKSPAPIVLAYQPTRWGGAKRVEIALDSCFDACGAEDTKPQDSAPHKRR
jgi:hypothetical protein